MGSGGKDKKESETHMDTIRITQGNVTTELVQDKDNADRYIAYNIRKDGSRYKSSKSLKKEGMHHFLRGWIMLD